LSLSLPKLLEDDFQFVLCEGCRQESPNLKLLTCLHTLCLDCLRETKPVGQCPVCRMVIPQASGIPDMDNLLFTSLQTRLKVYKKIVDRVDLFCDNCKEASEFWCSECEEFLCTKCFEAHQRYLKRESHEATRVMDIRAGSAKDFLKGTKRTGNFSCSNPAHKSQMIREHCQPHGGLPAGLPAHHQPCAPVSDPSGGRGHVCPDQGGYMSPTQPIPPALLMQRDEEAEEASESALGDTVPLPRSIQDSLASLQEDFSGWAKSNVQQADKLLKIGNCLLQAQRRANRHLVSMTQEIRAMSRSLATIAPAVEPLLQPAANPWNPPTADVDWPSLPSNLLELFPPSTLQNHEPPVSTSTSAKRKKVQDASVLTLPVKVMKSEDNDDGWNQTVLLEPSCLGQPGTSSSVSPKTLAQNPQEDVPDDNGGQHDSDSDILCMDSFEEDSSDEESMDSSVLDDHSYTLDGSTSEDYLGFSISSQNTLDMRQGSLVFFDLKILKNKSIQMTVVDGEKIFPVLIQPVKHLPSLMAENRVYEIGLRNLLCHLNSVDKPILGGFGLWSLPFPILLKALTVMNKKEEFSSVVYGFLDILPLIKKEIPKMDSYKLRNLASAYLWCHFGDGSAMENANIVKYLCKVLDVNLVSKPGLILSQASLETFISLQPLLTEKLLTKPSAQTLAAYNVGLSELRSWYQRDPEKGLQQACRLVNALRHSSEKEVRNLSKVKVYFQHE
ncbi:PML protein, partial [Pelecanoides urinatrix]|nr:PML protein [Pelecanoides urinatrix]